MGSLNSNDIYTKAHQSRYIDYATIHVWALNWGWFNPFNSPGTYPFALSQAKSYIQSHITSARTLNKPLTMEEFGLPRDFERFNAGSPTTARDNYYAALLKTIYDSAAAGSPIAGSNFWGWGGEGRSPSSDYAWHIGDPFVCDPPMEKQGLNSTYDTDSSTIHVMIEHSALMALLPNVNEIAQDNMIEGFELCQNYPNPFNPSTTIKFSVPTSGHVSIRVFDMLGREMETLFDGFTSKGVHEITFDGFDLPSGVYFYRIIHGNHSETKHMILLR